MAIFFRKFAKNLNLAAVVTLALVTLSVSANAQMNTEALLKAAVLANAGTITLTGNINLTSEIAITTGTVEINGGNFQISGEDACRIFNISTGAKLIIKDITLTKGKISGIGAIGGAVYNNGGIFEAMDCSFSNNNATGSAFVANGGAVYNAGTFEATGCSFLNNKVTNSSYDANGGAVYNNNGTFTYSSACSFSGNTANGSPNDYRNESGSTIQIKAAPPECKELKWADNNTDNPRVLLDGIVSADGVHSTLTAGMLPPTFATIQHIITVSAGSGGSVSYNSSPVTAPLTVNCTSPATSVTLIATANPDYEFVNWTKGSVEVSTNATYTFPATENVSLVANFINPNVKLLKTILRIGGAVYVGKGTKVIMGPP